MTLRWNEVGGMALGFVYANSALLSVMPLFGFGNYRTIKTDIRIAIVLCTWDHNICCARTTLPQKKRFFRSSVHTPYGKIWWNWWNYFLFFFCSALNLMDFVCKCYLDYRSRVVVHISTSPNRHKPFCSGGKSVWCACDTNRGWSQGLSSYEDYVERLLILAGHMLTL